MSAKVEVLTDRIGKARKTPDPLRAVRHFDAARKKLARLQGFRRELKAQLAQCIIERDAALSEIDRLRSERDARLVDLGRAEALLNAREAVIAEFRDDRTRLIEKYEPVITVAQVATTEPALTVRVLEKIDSAVADPADEAPADDVTVADGRQLFGWVKRLLPRMAP
jgi:chromosome segregation ATPase